MTTRFRSMRWPRLTALPLAAEITILLAVKLALLFALARLFFAEPEAKHMRMDPERVEQHLFASRSIQVFGGKHHVSHR
jgi:hypothetical protein